MCWTLLAANSRCGRLLHNQAGKRRSLGCKRDAQRAALPLPPVLPPPVFLKLATRFDCLQVEGQGRGPCHPLLDRLFLRGRRVPAQVCVVQLCSPPARLRSWPPPARLTLLTANLRPPPFPVCKQIPAGDIVGATTRGTELIIWHAPLASKPGADKPTRRLRRTPPLRLESAAAAEQAQQHVRRAACWRNGQVPPRLLVVVNPASGPGRCVYILRSSAGEAWLLRVGWQGV